MSVPAIREQLLSKIPELQDDESLLSECTSVCQNFNISGEEFFYQLEATRYSANDASRASEARVLTREEVEDIKKTNINNLNKKRVKGQAAATRSTNTNEMMMMMMRRGLKNVKPSINGASTKHTPGASVGVTFVQPSADPKKTKYRYMYEKISERSEVLDERIDEFGELVKEHYNLEDLGDPSSSTEEEIVVVGRFCADADTASTSHKLTEGSIFIETSRMLGSGSRTPLRFSTALKLKGTTKGAGAIGIFPGAIAALRGRNGGGGLFVVDEILGLPPLLPSLEQANHKAFSMAVACGPYTYDTDLEFKHFKSFMAKAGPMKPPVLLLLGPFVDASHPWIKSGDIDQMPEDIFRDTFVDALRIFLGSSPESLVLLQPSIRDILSDHPVLPQCELDNEFLADPRVKMIPNPCRFSINGVSFATTSVDTLAHLKSQEYSQRGQEVDPLPPVSSASSATDSFTNLCRHILQQRSFYPLFPVPQDLSADVNLDISHSDGLRLCPDQPESAPDVLLFPSKFKQFTKLVDSTWAINPSFLTKSTYARIHVPSVPRSELRERIQCEIARL